MLFTAGLLGADLLGAAVWLIETFGARQLRSYIFSKCVNLFQGEILLLFDFKVACIVYTSGTNNTYIQILPECPGAQTVMPKSPGTQMVSPKRPAPKSHAFI